MSRDCPTTLIAPGQGVLSEQFRKIVILYFHQMTSGHAQNPPGHRAHTALLWRPGMMWDLAWGSIMDIDRVNMLVTPDAYVWNPLSTFFIILLCITSHLLRVGKAKSRKVPYISVQYMALALSLYPTSQSQHIGYRIKLKNTHIKPNHNHSC